MYQVIIFLFLVLSSFYLQAQERWGSYESGLAGNHFQLIETCYDTVETASGIRVERLYISSGFPFDWNLGRFMKGDSVMIVDLDRDDDPRLLYDYGLEVGDSIDVSWGDFMVVIETSKEIILGKERKKIILEGGWDKYQDTWIEDIGSIKNGYLSPGLPDIIFDASSNFSCYYTEAYDEWYLTDREFYKCLADSINNGCFVSGTKNHVDLGIQLFPVPAEDFISIELSNGIGNQEECEIYDTNGRLVLRNSADYFNGRIDISNLEDGIYYLRLLAKEGYDIRKFVKN